MESYQNIAERVLKESSLDGSFKVETVQLISNGSPTWRNHTPIIEVLHSIVFEDPKKQFIYNLHGGDAVFVPQVQFAYKRHIAYQECFGLWHETAENDVWND